MNNEFENKMEKLADRARLSYDGNGDNRLFYEEEPGLNVCGYLMTREEYERMEKEIDSFEITGKGFTVYVWNDVSGYDYWSQDLYDWNYIMVTACVKNPDIVDPEELLEAMSDAYGEFCCWDNSDEAISRQYDEMESKQ